MRAVKWKKNKTFESEQKGKDWSETRRNCERRNRKGERNEDEGNQVERQRRREKRTRRNEAVLRGKLNSSWRARDGSK